MIIILTPYRSERLDYICQFIFGEQLGVRFEIMTDEDSKNIEFNAEHFVISYGSTKKLAGAFSMPCKGLLFEKGIQKQSLSPEDYLFSFEEDISVKIFFQEKGYSFPFDLFSATFYLITRYEEYLPHEKDSFGRFPHTASLAFQDGFLNQPLVNIWLHVFMKSLQMQFDEIKFNSPSFQSMVTYDVDMAWSYKNKGFFRNFFGFLQKPTMERLLVLAGVKNDPFDSFDFLEKINQKGNLNNLFFFLMSKNRTKYDKNISPKNPEWISRIQKIAAQNSIGIHPSFNTINDQHCMNEEKETLAAITKKNIIRSRQHYLRFHLPETYRLLIASGIEKEYSMGYGSINGFRASFAGSFSWYDLQKEKTTSLRIYPFSYMDANSIFEEKTSPDQAELNFKEQWEYCKKTNGLFISVFHNHLLAENKKYKRWRSSFERIISLIRQ